MRRRKRVAIGAWCQRCGWRTLQFQRSCATGAGIQLFPPRDGNWQRKRSRFVLAIAHGRREHESLMFARFSMMGERLRFVLWKLEC